MICENDAETQDNYRSRTISESRKVSYDLDKIETFKHRQLSHSLLQNRLCGIFGDAVGKVPEKKLEP